MQDMGAKGERHVCIKCWWASMYLMLVGSVGTKGERHPKHIEKYFIEGKRYFIEGKKWFTFLPSIKYFSRCHGIFSGLLLNFTKFHYFFKNMVDLNLFFKVSYNFSRFLFIQFYKIPLFF